MDNVENEIFKDEMEGINQEIDDKCSVDVVKKFQLFVKILENNWESVEIFQ